MRIAGSDSSGGAGIQADLKTFHQFGVYGTSAITAVTAQNTIGVSAWQALPAALVAEQIDALAEDLRPAAIKTGMLGSREIVDTVAERIAHHRLTTYVLDPVMVATSGDRLLERDAEQLIARRLAPLALLVTPNLNEAEILVDAEVRTLDQMERAGRALVAMGARAALVKARGPLQVRYTSLPASVAQVYFCIPRLASSGIYRCTKCGSSSQLITLRTGDRSPNTGSTWRTACGQAPGPTTCWF